MVRWVLAFLFASMPALAANWSGALVDAKCYEAQERNKNARDTLDLVDRDREYEIRYCTPTAKTKSFMLVDHDSLSYKLDPAGDTKASDLFQKTGRRKYFMVNITGELTKNTLKVESIATTQ